MPELPRNLPHLYLRGNGKAEPYTSKLQGPRHPLPQRDRATHATKLMRALNAALAAAAVQKANRDPAIMPDDAGYYFDF